MKLTTHLTNRFREIFLNGQWVTGTNFREQIIDLSWEDAIMKIDSLNTIADLTFHVHYYVAGILNVLEGGKLEIRDKNSFDAPPINHSQDWKKLVGIFCRDAEKFARRLEIMPEEDLTKIFAERKYSDYLRNIDALIEHGCYHLGQIILIKKMILNKAQ